jgi:5'-methylthioadenosine phosphorylase
VAGPPIGIIGGSGLRELAGLEDGQARFLVTPHGAPSEPPVVGRLGDVEVAFLARHGREHKIPPHKLNHRANVWALKEIGATRVIGTSSTGSLKKAIRPGSVVVPHDFVSFWDIPTYHDSDVVHATPRLDDDLRETLVAAAKAAGVPARSRGVYVQTTGPRLETRAEIAHFAKLGDVVGMTMGSEATLAAELGLAYASLCSVDNYANGIVETPLVFDAIRGNQAKNASAVVEILKRAVEAFA